ncbi:hypothetical protein HY624_01510 [Candidatus Uhrbacteria bacterium]|nr:hypothetical protein [Candidatus Uhrbacteria bacterium]
MKKLSVQQIIGVVKKSQWFIQGFNAFPLYLHSAASMTGWMVHQAVGVNYSHFFYVAHESRMDMYYDERDLVAIGEAYYKKIHNIQELNTLRRKHRDAYLAARKKTGDFSIKGLGGCSLNELIALAQRLINELTMTVSFAHVIEGIAWISERRLHDFLAQRTNANKKDEQLFSSPVDPSFILRAQMLLGAIKKSAGAARTRKIEQFILEFGWLDSSFVGGKTFDARRVREMVRGIKHVSSLEGLKRTKQLKLARARQLELTPEETFVVRTIELCTLWQDNRKEFILSTIARFEPVVVELARRLHISADALKCICPAELTEMNLSRKKFLAVLEKRFHGCGYYVVRDHFLTYPGKAYRDIEQKLTSTNESKVGEFHGTIANQGKVTGIVKICQTIEDIAKVKEGEVLVAFMTRPEFLPAMQKAAAFVTNEGGITSHAAIVAREMNKPCIIGTKIATDVLHDGDVVEVNANHGVVTIIQRV